MSFLESLTAEQQAFFVRLMHELPVKSLETPVVPIQEEEEDTDGAMQGVWSDARRVERCKAWNL
jgi:hypothetical protein